MKTDLPEQEGALPPDGLSLALHASSSWGLWPAGPPQQGSDSPHLCSCVSQLLKISPSPVGPSPRTHTHPVCSAAPENPDWTSPKE